ncbi:MAG TPA: 30S ribosomal protein S8 [Psychrobacter sp.]|mgnify:FL=1|uniref:Small ribosomal subunit protein uS8 n=1 Tax=Psychrobacter pasteurii TaxID=1945520 RepID=A0A1R4EEY7_9GAMM|nr:30S ribosomal protein S8 [Psychrobacter pasteurii]SJM37042.1 30S ribosomal protein S8 [Psychrobacter pasteurii]HAO59946.1 30S ribosomal protein S8 [Psychrobacter sp.]HJH08923.1 30S ribosomal protein S8 [Psychrobacter pasteurii]
MSMQDTVADMLTRIRNAQMARKVSVAMPSSKLRKSIADLLVQEGYIASAEVTEEGNGKATLSIELKYFEGKPVIEVIKRYSRPGLRQYRGKDAIPSVQQGLGVAIVSTSQGIMSDRAARAAGIGGEIIAFVA